MFTTKTIKAINKSDNTTLIDPVIIPAILIPRLGCFRLRAIAPKIIAGMPANIPAPRSDTIPRTSDAIGKSVD
jgi:hypothetical protein